MIKAFQKSEYRYSLEYITEKFSKYLIRRFLNGSRSMHHEETLVQISLNLSKWSFVHFHCQQMLLH